MDLHELATLKGDALTEAVKTLKTEDPAAHATYKAIHQIGFRAGHARGESDASGEWQTKHTTSEEALTAARADLEAAQSRIKELSEAQPDVATLQGAYTAELDALSAKVLALEAEKKTSQEAHARELDARDRSVFGGEVKSLLQASGLRPREVLIGTKLLEDRFARNGGAWKLYEDDGKTPIPYAETDDPASVLVASYTASLPKEAFTDNRPKGPGFRHDGETGGKVISTEAFLKLTPQEQAQVGMQAARGEVKILQP